MRISNYIPLLSFIFVSSMLVTSALANITSDLRAYYQFNEGSGTTAVDSSSNGNTGTLEGSPLPLWVDSINPYFGNAIGFDTQNYVNTSLNMPSGDWTFSEWVSVSLCPSGVCNFFGSGGEAPNLFQLGYDSGVLDWAGYIVYSKYGFGESTCANDYVAFDYNISDAGWTHLTVVYDESESELRLYINGTLNDTDSQAGCDLGNVTYVSYPSPDGVYGTNGMVDDARFYSRALTDSDVSELFAIDHVPTPTTTTTPSGIASALTGLGSGVGNIFSSISLPITTLLILLGVAAAIGAFFLMASKKVAEG